ncbi:MAG: TatD family hydrolase [Thermoplasmata archaeon]|nr:TatD family hydrolase [Thermoplasmata archaeon]MCI4357160.1 TatD family hydrolase [Thermoplasmata archaeon]
MTLPPDLPVVDHHCHLSPNGEGVAAARRFRKAGGTHLFLATQAYAPGPITTLAGYESQFETTERLSQTILREAGVVVYNVVAPYPVDLIAAGELIGVPAARDLHRAALDLAGHWVREGRAVALGEVGRPHFPTSPEVRAAADEVFVHALEVGRDVGCPVVIHSEDLDPEAVRELARLARSVEFPAGRLVKHYQRRLFPPDLVGTAVPSYLARRELCDESLGSPGSWFWETDFLDDPRRPGAVLDIETVPRRARAVAERTPDLIERLQIPFVKSVESVYGFRPDPAEAVPD